jgi:hypothetical protein
MSKVLIAKIERSFGIDAQKYADMTEDDKDPINTFIDELTYEVDELIKKRVDESEFAGTLIV